MQHGELWLHTTIWHRAIRISQTLDSLSLIRSNHGPYPEQRQNKEQTGYKIIGKDLVQRT